MRDENAAPGKLRIPVSRRGILKIGAAFAGGALPAALLGRPFQAVAPGSGPSPAASPAEGNGPRGLSFHHLHTGENLDVTFWRDGSPVASALEQIDHVLRDHYTGRVETIDIRLLHLLHRLRAEIGGGDRPFHVVSGYRSPETNERLRRQGGVAARSLHMFGQAVDIRLPGCPLPDLWRVALSLRAGGVGYYPRSDFIHVDVGRVRSW